MIWKFLGGSHGPLSRQSLIHVLRTRRESGQKRLWKKAISRLAAAATLAAIACSAPAGAADEQKVVSLPEVTVTDAASGHPSCEEVRSLFRQWVEEDKWPDIPRSDSRVGVAAAATCETGRPHETAPVRQWNWSSA